MDAIDAIEFEVMSDEAVCLTTSQIGKLPSRKKLPVYQVIHDTMGELGQSPVCKVLIDGRPFLADAVSGSLYDPETLKCFTGPLTLKEV